MDIMSPTAIFGYSQRPIQVHPERVRARRFFAPTGNAVKHFRSRIRENSDDLRAFRILTNSATIRSQAFFRVRKCFTAVPRVSRKLGVDGRVPRKIRSRELPPDVPKIWDGGTRCPAKAGHRSRRRIRKTSCVPVSMPRPQNSRRSRGRWRSGGGGSSRCVAPESRPCVSRTSPLHQMSHHLVAERWR
jgi:hypothetical protein